MRKLLGSVVLLLGFFLYGTSLSQQAASQSEIETVSTIWADLFNQGSIEELSELYLEDAVFRHSTGRIISGKEAIQSWLQGTYDNGVRFESETLAAEELAEDIAFIRALWIAKTLDNHIVEQGEHMLILKRESEQWNIFQQFSSLGPLVIGETDSRTQLATRAGTFQQLLRLLEQAAGMDQIAVLTHDGDRIVIELAERPPGAGAGCCDYCVDDEGEWYCCISGDDCAGVFPSLDGINIEGGWCL
jgi:ketosteroid isomerase-like protein